MNDELMKKILRFDKEGNVNDLGGAWGGYIDSFKGSDEVLIDGTVTIEQLEAILYWMKQNQES